MEAENYLNDQLFRIPDGGFNVVEEIFRAILDIK